MFSEFFLFQMAEIMLRLYRNGKRKNDQTETVPSNTIVYSYVKINKQSIYIQFLLLLSLCFKVTSDHNRPDDSERKEYESVSSSVTLEKKNSKRSVDREECHESRVLLLPGVKTH